MHKLYILPCLYMNNHPQAVTVREIFSKSGYFFFIFMVMTLTFC